MFFLLSSFLAPPSKLFLPSPCLTAALSFGERERDDRKLQQLSDEPFPLNIVTSPGAELLAFCGTSRQVYPSSHSWKSNRGESAERLGLGGWAGPHSTPDHPWVLVQHLAWSWRHPGSLEGVGMPWALCLPGERKPGTTPRYISFTAGKKYNSQRAITLSFNITLAQLKFAWA